MDFFFKNATTALLYLGICQVWRDGTRKWCLKLKLKIPRFFSHCARARRAGTLQSLSIVYNDLPWYLTHFHVALTARPRQFRLSNIEFTDFVLVEVDWLCCNPVTEAGCHQKAKWFPLVSESGVYDLSASNVNKMPYHVGRLSSGALKR